MSRKAFESARAQARQEPLEFDFGGSTYSVELPIPAFAVVEMANEDEVKAAGAFGTFLREVLGEKQYAAFSATARKDRTDIEVVAEIVGWIVEEATGRPTQQRPSSADGSSTDTPLLQVAATSAG